MKATSSTTTKSTWTSRSTFQGTTGSSYPFVELQTDPGTAADVAVTNPHLRPRPQVVAYGRTTNEPVPVVTVPNGARDVNARLLHSTGRTFGLLGTYDGDPVGIGRVVVDSTWHHWFSLNLHGFEAETPNTQYQLMQTYYRNVGLWLATAAQRQSMLVAGTWGIVVSDPMAFPRPPLAACGPLASGPSASWPEPFPIPCSSIPGGVLLWRQGRADFQRAG